MKTAITDASTAARATLGTVGRATTSATARTPPRGLIAASPASLDAVAAVGAATPESAKLAAAATAPSALPDARCERIRAPRQLQQSLRPPVPTRRLVHWHRQQAVRTAFPPTAARAARRRRDLLRARRLHLLRERRLVQSRWRVRLRRGVHRQHLRRDRPRVDEAKARWILGREQEGGHQRRRRGGGPAVPRSSRPAPGSCASWCEGNEKARRSS